MGYGNNDLVTVMKKTTGTIKSKVGEGSEEGYEEEEFNIRQRNQPASMATDNQ
jgi:hypothetical protein